MIEKVFGKRIWHPWVFAIYYVLFPYIINFQHLLVSSIIKPLVVVVVLTIAVHLFILYIAKDKFFAAILTSLLLILFFSYPPIYTISQLISAGIQKGVISFSQTLNISIVWILLSVLATILLLVILKKKSEKSIRYLTIALNAASVLLIVIIGGYLISKISQTRSSAGFAAAWQAKISSNTPTPKAGVTSKPDIYLIVLDAYASKEVLQDIYGYDNSRFEDELTRLGFQIIPNGRTNYNQTRTSFSSLLNMQYLDDVAQDIGDDAIDAHPLIYMIQNNLVTNRLRKEGYTVINFPSGYEYTESIQADYQIKNGVYLDNFWQTLLWNSVAYPFIHQKLYDWHRQNITGTMARLADLDGYSSPKFVIAHIFAPHPPFVFDKDGNTLTPDYPFTAIDADTLIQSTSEEYYRTHYPAQLEYVSGRILQTVKHILSDSSNPPIIILAGDHGPGLTLSLTNVAGTNQYERIHILNALYLPGVNADTISDDHTHVNTFRLIFNEYFGDDLPMLENRSYVSSYDQPYRFDDVTEEVRDR